MQGKRYFIRTPKPRTVLRTVVVVAALIGVSLVAWYGLPLTDDKSQITPQRENTPAALTEHDASVPDKTNNTSSSTNEHSRTVPESFTSYTEELDVTDAMLDGFLRILKEEQVPHSDLDTKLREITRQYPELLTRLGQVPSPGPEMLQVKAQARQSIETGDYATAEQLLKEIAEQDNLAVAPAYAALATLQRIRLRYAEAAKYWQKAVALLPESEKQTRASYLNKAGCDLYRLARYNDALPLFEQSLVLSRESKDKPGQGRALNSIAHIYNTQGDYDTALSYLEQSLAISKELDDKGVKEHTLLDISRIYQRRGDYETALRYLEQSLAVCRDMGNRVKEGRILSDIGQVYQALDNNAKALQYYQESLAISREISDWAGESRALTNLSRFFGARGDHGTALRYLEQCLDVAHESGATEEEHALRWNIDMFLKGESDLDQEEQYINQAVEAAEAVGSPKSGEWRGELE
ncbi:MAG: tetratricopeptide repeat protein [Candidatus Electrothrix aestuarii]|uniref:Tetratricopeptide repeat protein n=1 Tax=Candidatus Electrothrix aestuarii TaxID=3062594 RepID=A0AAU8LTN3_9BACT|nr:tetratricopeptide repeat protein [Candidatus Electrothrix aestuarii]